MTIDELLELTNTPANLASLSDADLYKLLEPLIPASRAAYIGPRTETVIVGTQRISKHQYLAKLEQYKRVLSQLPQDQQQ